MKTVHTISNVRIMNAMILALTLFVVLEQLVKVKLIELFVSVHRAYRVTPWLPVLKLVVHLILNVQTTKNVITSIRHQIVKNANLYVEITHVHKVPLVVHPIIAKYVLATILFKEMDTCPVQNVSAFLIQFL